MARDETHGLLALSALELRDRLARGALRSVELVAACLTQVTRREPEVQAWAWLDGDHAMAEAERLDKLRATGRPVGLLHGLPVGVKDIIDTRGIPTENGTPLDRGRVPTEDAVVVRRLKAQGALVLGKTVTCELAGIHPSRTRNPVNPAHTPGGSSAGSAAAVSAGMVPLALGTQTGGSVIRPAAFCGIVGFKPSFGAIARTGILMQAPHLDTPGLFGRSVEDVALAAEAIWGGDPGDPMSVMAAPPRLLEVALARPPVPPVLAAIGWDGLEPEPEMAAAMAELAELLGEQCFAAPLPAIFAAEAEIRERITLAELAKSLHRYEARGADQLSAEMQGWLAKGKAVLARDYLAALDWPEVFHAALAEVLERADALLLPATPGPAPEGLATTGSPAFNGLFTLTGMPAVTLPLFRGSNGLPMGVQLVGRRGDDGRLLRTARWLMRRAAEEET